MIIRDSAAAVFVSTAISQSGRLDTVFVLTAHFRMVWRIACVYSQRPALRDLINLYANVAATAFVAGELDEAEIGEQIEPILSSALGAVSLSVPGRTGRRLHRRHIDPHGSRQCLSHTSRGDHRKALLRHPRRSADRRTLRRSATAEAAKLLGVHRQERHSPDLEGPVGCLEGQGGGAFSGLTGFACDVKDSLLELLKLKRGEE